MDAGDDTSGAEKEQEGSKGGEAFDFQRLARFRRNLSHCVDELRKLRASQETSQQILEQGKRLAVRQHASTDSISLSLSYHTRRLPCCQIHVRTCLSACLPACQVCQVCLFRPAYL